MFERQKSGLGLLARAQARPFLVANLPLLMPEQAEPAGALKAENARPRTLSVLFSDVWRRVGRRLARLFVASASRPGLFARFSLSGHTRFGPRDVGIVGYIESQGPIGRLANPDPRRYFHCAWRLWGLGDEELASGHVSCIQPNVNVKRLT